MASLKFPYRIFDVEYYKEFSYISFKLGYTCKGMWKVYNCTFRIPRGSAAARSAFNWKYLWNTIERNACFVNSQVLRDMELHSDMSYEFEQLYTGFPIHVYDFCKLILEYANKNTWLKKDLMTI